MFETLISIIASFGIVVFEEIVRYYLLPPIEKNYRLINISIIVSFCCLILSSAITDNTIYRTFLLVVLHAGLTVFIHNVIQHTYIRILFNFNITATIFVYYFDTQKNSFI